MTTPDIIATPLNYRIQWFCTRVLPIFGFIAALVITGGLWRHKHQMPNAIGEIEALRMDVASGLDGFLVELSGGDDRARRSVLSSGVDASENTSNQWSLFDRVAKGDVVARLDDRPVRAELATMAAEVTRLAAEVRAEGERVRRDDRSGQLQHHRERMRLIGQLEQNRLSILDRQVQIEVDRVEKERLNVQLEYMVPLAPGGFISPEEIDNTRLLREIVIKRLEANKITLVEVEKQLEASAERWQQMPELDQADAALLASPFRAAIRTEEARIEHLQIEIGRLVLRSPTTGTVVAIYKHPGQEVMAGDPILTIASEHGRYIVSYVQSSQVRVKQGDSVAIRAKRFGARQEVSTIQKVGPQVELLPPRHLRDPSRPEWGLPIHVAIPPGLAARPGELVDLTFSRTL